MHPIRSGCLCKLLLQTSEAEVLSTYETRTGAGGGGPHFPPPLIYTSSLGKQGKDLHSHLTFPLTLPANKCLELIPTQDLPSTFTVSRTRRPLQTEPQQGHKIS